MKDSYPKSVLAAEIDSIVNELVKEHNVKVDDICKALDISDNTLMNYRRGVSEPKASTLWKLRAMGAKGEVQSIAQEELKRFGFTWKNIKKLVKRD